MNPKVNCRDTVMHSKIGNLWFQRGAPCW